MVYIDMNLQFFEIQDDLSGLSDYVELISDSWPSLVGRETERIDALVADEDDDVAWQIRGYLKKRLVSGVSLRFLGASIMVASWAVYELGVKKVAERLRESSGVGLRIDDLRGGFLERASKYFNGVLQLPLHPAGTDWDELRRIEMIRHALAHTSGRVPDIRGGSLEQIRKACKLQKGMRLEDGFIIVPTDEAAKVFDHLRRLLEDLVGRARTRF